MVKPKKPDTSILSSEDNFEEIGRILGKKALVIKDFPEEILEELYYSCVSIKKSATKAVSRTENLPFVTDRDNCGFEFIYARRIGKNKGRPLERKKLANIHRGEFVNFLSPILRKAGLMRKETWQGQEPFTFRMTSMKTEGYIAAQEPHIDYPDYSDFDAPSVDIPLVAIIPLTVSGCILALWPDYGMATMVRIEYGHFIVMRGDLVHAGGFVSNFQTGDLRSHMYIFKPNNASGVQLKNRHTDRCGQNFSLFHCHDKYKVEQLVHDAIR